MAKFYSTVPDASSFRLSEDEIRSARLLVADHAHNVTDLRNLLSALGLAGTKQCVGCSLELELYEYETDPRALDGRVARCRTCVRFQELRQRRSMARARTAH